MFLVILDRHLGWSCWFNFILFWFISFWGYTCLAKAYSWLYT